MIWTQVGERLSRIREERNLTKAQFGRLIGVSGQYVGMMEKGTHVLSVELVINICNCTGVSADYLLFGIADPANDKTTAAALNGLSPEQIQIALDIIKKVAQFVNTENGNEVLIQEVASQQRTHQAMRD